MSGGMLDLALAASVYLRDPEAEIDRLCAAWRERERVVGAARIPDDTLREIMRLARRKLKKGR